MGKSEDREVEVKLDPDEEEQVRKREGLRSPVIYEIIAREGEDELERPAFSLAVSGLTAGIAIGFSIVGLGVLHAHLPDTPWRPLLESFGYTIGFLLIILARLQLFTENTITPVLPLLLNPTWNRFLLIARLWSIVLAANTVGCLAFAGALRVPGILPDETFKAILELSAHVMELSPWEMFVRGIASGWLIAALVWLLPTAEAAKFWAIIVVTYLIAVGGFTHIVAGSVEAFSLVLEGDLSLGEMAFGFFLPVLAGNICGGTVLFAMFSYGQVSQETA